MPGDVLMKAQQALARPAKELGKRKYPLEHTDPVAHHQHVRGGVKKKDKSMNRAKKKGNGKLTF